MGLGPVEQALVVGGVASMNMGTEEDRAAAAHRPGGGDFVPPTL
jgi:hypothetical protein